MGYSKQVVVVLKNQTAKDNFCIDKRLKDIKNTLLQLFTVVTRKNDRQMQACHSDIHDIAEQDFRESAVEAQLEVPFDATQIYGTLLNPYVGSK